MLQFSSFHIPQKATEAYEAKGPALIDHVNRAIATAENVQELIGGNPLDVVYANHRHHHGVMSNVMRMNAWEMLRHVVPWVYRSYHSHGLAWDYFPKVFDAWIDAIRVHLPEQHQAPLIDLYKAFLETHEQHIALSAQRPKHDPFFQPPWDAVGEKLIDLLTLGDASGVMEIGERFVKDADGLEAFYIGALAPAMFEIGLRWEDGRLSVAHEHLASGVVNRAMAYWYHHVLAQKKSKGKVLITCAPGEFHAIGGAMLADLFTIDGWQSIQLGANTPTEDLKVLFDSFQPDILGISVAMPFNIHNTTKMIQAIRAIRGGERCRIMVGGQAFNPMPSVWRETGADYYAVTARDAVTIGREIWSQRSA